MTVVVTGASGYIGGQVTLNLVDAGHTVIGIDCRPCPTHLTEAYCNFVQDDFAGHASLSAIIQAQPTAIVHCAGTSLVAPSLTDPAEYYQNNVVKTIELLDLVRNALPKCRIIFSSSAAVYGVPVMDPCHEVDPREPISPYGQSKFIIEMIMASYREAYGLDYVAFRYFNACGADSQARHGQELGATHIIARALESVCDHHNEFVLNGNDFPTNDGSCVRDYVHVEDIANAHVIALNKKIPAGVYNLGSRTGTSNQEIIAAVERITGVKLKVTVGTPRAGDPPVLTANADKFTALANWRKYTLDDMISHAWDWYTR